MIQDEAIGFVVIEREPRGENIRHQRAGGIAPQKISIMIGKRLLGVGPEVKTRLIGRNNQRADGRVLAQKRALGTAQELDMIEIGQVEPGEADMCLEDVVDDEPDAGL
jgi:hypothetical protein